MAYTYQMSRHLVITLVSVCIVLVIVNALLLRRISRLYRVNKALITSAKVETGTRLPAFIGYDKSGKKIVIDYGIDSRSTLLLMLSPRCHACEENWPYWNRLISAVDRSKVRVFVANIATNAPVTEEYAQRHQINDVPIITEVAADSFEAYKLGFTPETFLIDNSGTVRKVDTGILKDEFMAGIGELSNAGSAH